MPIAELLIINKLGLHARASAKLAQLAAGYTADIWLERNVKRVSAKSIMGVMMLAASQGTTLTVETVGIDAEAAMTAVIDLVSNRFDEEE